MAKKPIKGLLEYMGLELDEQTLKILRILERNKDVSENDLAEKLKVKINAIRKSLYKLSDLGFVYYTRKKDEEKKWWYLYYWHIDQAKILSKYYDLKRKELKDKVRLMEAETKYAFACKNCGNKAEYDFALESNFMCNECGSVFEEIKTKRAVNKINAEIEELEKEIAKAA